MDHNTLQKWTRKAVLIYGPHKSGSSLCQRLLDGHPSVWCYPTELKLKFYLKKPASGRTESLAFNQQFCLLDGVEHQNWDKQKFQQLNETIGITCCGLGDYICGLAQASWASTSGAPKHPMFWIAKEVGGNPETVLNGWMQLFFDGKVVLNFRHPLHVVRSIILLRRRTSLSMSLHRMWRALNDTLRVTWFCAQMAKEPWAIPVLYESITGEAKEPILRQLCAFLDIPFDTVLLSPTIFGEKTVVGTSSRQTTEVFSPEKKWQKGLRLHQVIWMGAVHYLLNHYYSRKAGMWHLRRYDRLSRELIRVANAKAV